MFNSLDTDKHIILIGFKHVGKSVIGEKLAKNIHKPFVDLDRQIEDLFHQEFQEKLSSRQIMERHGETFFRNLESNALRKTLQLDSSVIALGGGTPLTEENQAIIKPHLLLYIKAPLEVVFQRIMNSGQPAFFPVDQDPYRFFCQLWEKREKIYEALATFSVDNDSSINEAVLRIMESL